MNAVKHHNPTTLTITLWAPRSLQRRSPGFCLLSLTVQLLLVARDTACCALSLPSSGKRSPYSSATKTEPRLLSAVFDGPVGKEAVILAVSFYFLSGSQGGILDYHRVRTIR